MYFDLYFFDHFVAYLRDEESICLQKTFSLHSEAAAIDFEQKSSSKNQTLGCRHTGAAGETAYRTIGSLLGLPAAHTQETLCGALRPGGLLDRHIAFQLLPL